MRHETLRRAYLNVEATECLIFVKRSRQAIGPTVQPFNLTTGRGPSTWRQRSIISRMLPVAGLADHADVDVDVGPGVEMNGG
jgi:hypothetical protein